MMSDNSVDVILSDMALIYVDPFKIDKTVKEMKRVTRRYILLCELTSNSWWEQLKLLWNTGYHGHQYKKILEKHGFYDIMEWKMTPEMWPGGGQQEKCGKFILATVIKRK
jgi:ubiquinone/menaquinone biosynthesis C-methylase UbiE